MGLEFLIEVQKRQQCCLCIFKFKSDAINTHPISPYLGHFTYFYGNVLEHMLLWSSAYIHLTTSSVFLKDLATVRITTPSIKALNLHFPIQNYVYSISIMIYVCQWILPSPPSFSLYANGWASPLETSTKTIKCCRHIFATKLWILGDKEKIIENMVTVKVE